MKYLKSFLLLAGTYILIQGLGLWIANGGLWIQQGLVEQIKNDPGSGVVKDPDSPFSAVLIFGYVLVGTAMILILLKLNLRFLMKLLINAAILSGLILTLGGLFDVYGLAVGFALFLARLRWPDDMMLMNLVLVCTVPGVGSWLGSSLGFEISLLLLVALAVYDVVAVFGTKHMVTLAEGSESQAPMMFAIPVGERVLGLGTGDLTIPLVFTASLLRQHTLETSLITAAGGLIGLAALFVYTTQKKDVVLPALPPITAGLLLGYAVSLLL
jgi:presenilin-like A22 family membrane protease